MARAIVLALGLAVAASAAAAEPRRVTASSPEAAAAQLGLVADQEVVLLKLSAPVGADTPLSYRNAEGDYVTEGECAFGAMPEVREIAPAIADNHLLATVVVGDAERHAANLVACEYAPDVEGMARVTIRGCYLALSVSIPTARELVLHPLPADACGLTR